MRVFVTGAGGILGGYVLQHLTRLLPDAEIVRNTVDLTDPIGIGKKIRSDGGFDLVLHLAAVVPVSEVQQDPAKAYAVNVAGTIHLLDALKEQTCRVVYCSSGHVYSSSPDPVKETALIAPVSLYGRTKWLGEIAAQDIAEAQGISLCIARVFSIHDPKQSGPFLRPKITERLSTEDLSQPFELWGADSIRDFLTADDAGALFVRLALSKAVGAVNIGSGEGTTVADFVQSLSPVQLDIKSQGLPDTLVADITRLQSAIEVTHA